MARLPISSCARSCLGECPLATPSRRLWVDTLWERLSCRIPAASSSRPTARCGQRYSTYLREQRRDHAQSAVCALALRRDGRCSTSCSRWDWALRRLRSRDRRQLAVECAESLQRGSERRCGPAPYAALYDHVAVRHAWDARRLSSTFWITSSPFCSIYRSCSFLSLSIIVIDFFWLRRSDYLAGDGGSRGIEPPALAAWAVGASVAMLGSAGLLRLTGFAAIDALIVTAALYVILRWRTRGLASDETPAAPMPKILGSGCRPRPVPRRPRMRSSAGRCVSRGGCCMHVRRSCGCARGRAAARRASSRA